LCCMSTALSTHGDKSQAISPNEQRVYLAGVRLRVITLKEVTGIVGNYATARMTVWRLSKKGYLLRAREGMYAAVPPEFLGSNFEVDRYILAHRSSGPSGALAFHSALELHGVAHSPFTTVYYLSTKKARPFEFQDIAYRSVWASRLFGVTTTGRNGVDISVTDKERTLLDCLRRPDLCGGLEELLKSAEGLALLDSGKLMEYLRRFGERSLYQRTGLVLSALQDKIRVPDDLLGRLRDRVGPNAYYLYPGMRTGKSKFVKEWNVIVPRNLAELMRFV
jgi:predicted transcriptional regulator of viral defense system